MATPVQIKPDPDDIGQRILDLCQESPQGIGDKVLQTQIPDVDPKVRAKVINQLLVSGKIELLKSESLGLLYKFKDPSKTTSTIKGDQEEKIVYKIIEEAGNKGTWIRDIRINSNLSQTQLNKVLKSLESKKLIKVVKSVNATKKKVYMLYNLEPDQSVTGGAWYSDQDFESEFVEILNQQCYRYLHSKLDQSRKSNAGPLAARNLALVSSKEVLKFISDLGISKIALRQEDIESILDTLIYDGKAERTVVAEGTAQVRLYRAVEPLLPTTGLVRIPCGVCPVVKFCSSVGSVNPSKCVYIKEWFS